LAAAHEALNAGDFGAARARAAEVLEIDTQNADAIAIDKSAHLRAVDRQNQEWLAKAQELLAADNLTGADELLQQILKQSPQLADATRLRADIAMRRGRHEENAAQKRAVARA